MMKRHHEVRNVRSEEDFLAIEVDGHDRKIAIAEISKVLSTASEEERNIFEVSPSGYGIHWPSLDEDVSIDALLGIAHTPSWAKKSA
jgi:hypothetical protein